MSIAYKADRVRETTSTTGTGTYDLGGAAAGHQAFSDAFSSGVFVWYCATNDDDWEVGGGTLTHGTPDTLSRIRVYASSNGGSAVNWPSGEKSIFCAVPAEYFDVIAISDAGVNNAATATSRGGVAFGDAAVSGAVDAFAMGYQANAGATSSFAFMDDADADGQYSMALGNACQTTADYSRAIGRESKADIVGQEALSSGKIGSKGDVQASRIHIQTQTTDGSSQDAKPNGALANHITLPANRTWMFRVMISARQTSGSAGTVGDSYCSEHKGLIKRDGSSNTALVGSVTDSIVAEDTGATAWTVAVTADDTNEALKVTVTGEANKTIHWSGLVELIEAG